MDSVLRALSVIENEFLVSHAVLSFASDGKVFGIVRATEESVGMFDSSFKRKVAHALRHHFAGDDELDFLCVSENYNSETGGFDLTYSDGLKGSDHVVVRADLVEVF